MLRQPLQLLDVGWPESQRIAFEFFQHVSSPLISDPVETPITGREKGAL
jgi:hypothetical protein